MCPRRLRRKTTPFGPTFVGQGCFAAETRSSSASRSSVAPTGGAHQKIKMDRPGVTHAGSVPFSTAFPGSWCGAGESAHRGGEDIDDADARSYTQSDLWSLETFKTYTGRDIHRIVVDESKSPGGERPGNL